MNNVWLVMVGEYSDRCCVGWCSTEEEARKVCAVRNWRGGNLFDYEVCGCLDRTVAGNVCAGWTREFEFCRDDDGWKVRYCSEPWLLVRHAPYIGEMEKSPGASPRLTQVRVRVWQRDDDVDRAKKAALDALYAYVAKKEGVAL